MMQAPFVALLVPAIALLVLGYGSVGELRPLLQPNRGDQIRSVGVELAEELQGASSDVTIRSFALKFDSSSAAESLHRLQEYQMDLFQGIDPSLLNTYSLLDYQDGTGFSLSNVMQGNRVKYHQKLNDIVLFDGVTTTNGVIKDLKVAKIVCMYKTSATVDELILDNLSKSANGDIHDDEGYVYQLHPTRCSLWEVLLIKSLPLFLTVCLAVSFTSVPFLKFKLGVFSALCIQFIFTLSASVTISKFFLSNFTLFHQLPFIQSLWLPFLFSFASFISIFSDYASFGSHYDSENESHLQNLRIRKAIISTFISSFNVFISVEFILASILVSTNSRLTSQYCTFTMICLLLNFIMLFSFLSMVVMLDMKLVKPLTNINQVVGVSLLESFWVSVIIMTIFLIIFIRWTAGDHHKSLLDTFLNKRGFVLDIQDLLHTDQLLEEFKVKIHDEILINLTEIPSNSHNWSFGYLLELLSIVSFVIFTTITILKMKLPLESKDSILFTMSINPELPKLVLNDSDELMIERESFNFKDLHTTTTACSEITQIYTSKCPFIISIDITNQILIWSPMNNPIPKPTKLPLGDSPIKHVSMSESGSLISVFYTNGDVKCWSRLCMSWIWEINIGDGELLESFFIKKKKKASVTKPKKISSSDKDTSASSKKELKPRKLRTRTPRKSTKTENTTKAPTTAENTPKLNKLDQSKLEHEVSAAPIGMARADSKYDSFVDLDKLGDNSKMEFIIILNNGKIQSIDCESGKVESNPGKTKDVLLLSSKILKSPRINDRIVSIKSDGNLLVDTNVNDKWIPRSIKIDNFGYNMGKSLITPAVLMNQSDSVQSVNELNNLTMTTCGYDEKDDTDVVIETVPFVSMIVKAMGLKAQLLDVQTGIVLKEWSIGQFQKNSFKVFHPELNHCKFCGCASVSNFSIGYVELTTNTLIIHTFSIDNRAKNNICLRVERDSRETRCLGFKSATEHQHWLAGVEGWCVTDSNLIIGIRKKGDGEEEEEEQEGMSVKNRFSKEVQRKHHQLKMHDIWEGFTMTSYGQVKFYELPTNEPALQPCVGPIKKFGHKSMIVPYGEALKIFFIGDDNLIEDAKDDDEDINGTLSFINRRKKLRMNKYELTHSTKY